MKYLTLVLLAIGAFGLNQYSYSIEKYTLFSKYAQIHYPDGLQENAKYIARQFDAIYEIYQEQHKFSPKDVHIYLRDDLDLSNGFYTPIPHNYINFFMVPPTNYLGGVTSWVDMLLTHELAHLFHINEEVGFPGELRDVFGNLFILYPSFFIPDFIPEGFATYQETHIPDKIGRGADGSFDGLMRSEYLDKEGFKTLSKASYDSDFPFNQEYVYGYQFFEAIDELYSQQKVFDYISHANTSIIPSRINYNNEKVIGKNIKEFWNIDFKNYITDKYTSQIYNIRNAGEVTDYKVSQETRNYKTPILIATNNDEVIYISHDFEKGSEVRKINNKNQDLRQFHLKSLDVLSADYKEGLGYIFSAPELCGTAGSNIYASIIYRDINGSEKNIFSCSRYILLSWLGDSGRFVGVRYLGGKAQIDLLNRSGEFIKTLYKAGLNKEINSIASNHDGTKIAFTMLDFPYPQQIFELDIDSLDVQKLTKTQEYKTSLSYSKDGQSIVFMSNRDGIQNIRKLIINERKIQTISNTLTNANNPALLSSGSLAYTTFRKDSGYYVSINKNHQVFNDYSANEDIDKVNVFAGRVDVNEYITEQDIDYNQTDYSSFNHLSPGYWAPLLLASNDNNYSIYGFTFGGGSPDVAHQYSITPLYYNDSSLGYSGIGGNISYTYSNGYALSNIRLLLSKDFETYIEDTNTEEPLVNLSTTETIIGITLPIYTDPRRTILFDVAAGKTWRNFYTNSPKYNNIDNISNENIEEIIIYDDAYSSLHSAQNIGGRIVNLFSKQYFLSDDEIDNRNENNDSNYQYTYGARWQEYFRLFKAISLEVLIEGGLSSSPYNPYRLGGTSNDDINDTKVALPGYSSSLAHLTGQNYASGKLNFNIPMWRIFDGFNAFPIGAQTTWLNLYATSAKAWGQTSFISNTINDTLPDTIDKNGDVVMNNKVLSSLGIEAGSELVLLYSGNVNINLGLAIPTDSLGENALYVKIGLN